MPRHVVEAGESVISLSETYQVPVEKIWNDPANRDLRTRERLPEILSPGDVLTIPEKEINEVEAATEQRHTFVLRGRTTHLRLRFLREADPRANEPYRLVVDGRHYDPGTLSGEGELDVIIPAQAREGEVWIGPPESQDHFQFGIGHLRPVSEVAGAQQRLNNLGFLCGEEDGILGPKTRAALSAFQRKHGLPATEKPDQATKAKLKEIHGS